MSFDFTDLHTLVVRAHDRYGDPIGKMMRVTLQAAANTKFPLYKGDASPLELSATERDWLLHLASSAEQQTETRWWTKHPWTKLRAILVPESKFWEWLDSERGSPKTAVAAPVPASELGPREDHLVVVSAPAVVARTPGKRAERRRNQRTRARMAIDAVLPEGVPDQSILGNGPLCTKVQEWLKRDAVQRNVPHVPISDDTILRAAGRQR
jgi:hypothetical protein